MHYVALGTVYVEMGRKDEGRRLIEKGLAMQNSDKDDTQVKQDGEQVLAKLK
jgi:hypothetical protein